MKIQYLLDSELENTDSDSPYLRLNFYYIIELASLSVSLLVYMKHNILTVALVIFV